MSERLADYEFHLMHLITCGLLPSKGNERHPTAIDLERRGLVEWTEQGWVITGWGRDAMKERIHE